MTLRTSVSTAGTVSAGCWAVTRRWKARGAARSAAEARTKRRRGVAGMEPPEGRRRRLRLFIRRCPLRVAAALHRGQVLAGEVEHAGDRQLGALAHFRIDEHLVARRALERL